MVCSRCKMAVRNVLEREGIKALTVELGEAELAEPLTAEQLQDIKSSLDALGFEIIDSQKSRLIEKIKTIIIEQVHYAEEADTLKLSAVLADKLHHDYSYLSNLFSAVEGTTIEKFQIAQKIERVKELLVYNELSLSAIATEMNYSSVAYLSAQFKQSTGLTPSQFKALQGNRRKNLEDL